MVKQKVREARIVRCSKCGKQIVSEGKHGFFCCNIQQDFNDDNVLKVFDTGYQARKFLIEKATNDDKETKKEGEVVVDDEKPLEVTEENPEDLEIEADEPENPLENIPEEPKVFNCPNCGNQLKEYEAICPKCFYEIEWQ